jgi:hypothetical protein
MTDYIKREDALKKLEENILHGAKEPPNEYMRSILGIIKCTLMTIPAADVVEVVRCVKCKHGLPLKAHADGVYGLNCAIGRGEECRNAWHKYSKHYEDYSLVDVDGFCDQGEEGQPEKDGDAHD